MCFSAPASFVAAGLAGAAGLASLARVQSKAELPLAAMPLVFAIQQTIEGFLWLTLANEAVGPTSSSLTEAFLMFALVLWPIYAPFTAYCIETDRRRRPWIAACLLAGLGTAAYFLLSLADDPRTAVISDGHIVYSADPALPPALLVLYPLATCGSLLLSSNRAVSLLGFIVFVGSIVAYTVYWNAFTSVWCFFAAAASALILYAFETARRRQAPLAGPAG